VLKCHKKRYEGNEQVTKYLENALKLGFPVSIEEAAKEGKF
jgi:hypothetical protein